MVEALRAVKDAGELELIRHAAALSDRVYGELVEAPVVGRTERELAWWIDRRFRELGAEGAAFDTMVGAGEMGARPHGEPRDAPIPSGTLVVVDTGCVVEGYRSDCTRTFLTGDDDRLAELYALCARAQLDGLAAVRAGAAGRDVDAASRVAIAEAGLAERFGHGLGHGVGIEIHEGPVLRPESEDVLQEGNVVTVEPGIYLDGDAGVRIEDLVVVTAEGCERLTTFTEGPAPRRVEEGLAPPGLRVASVGPGRASPAPTRSSRDRAPRRGRPPATRAPPAPGTCRPTRRAPAGRRPSDRARAPPGRRARSPTSSGST